MVTVDPPPEMVARESKEGDHLRPAFRTIASATSGIEPRPTPTALAASAKTSLGRLEPVETIARGRPSRSQTSSSTSCLMRPPWSPEAPRRTLAGSSSPLQIPHQAGFIPCTHSSIVPVHHSSTQCGSARRDSTRKPYAPQQHSHPRAASQPRTPEGRVSLKYRSWASSEAARKVMSANRRRDTRPELAVRRLVHAAGLRYRVDSRPIPSLNRRADLVFSRARVAVFIDGCYWHGCPAHGTRAKVNGDYWLAKIQRNRDRDAETNRLLRAAGWVVLRAWEHELPHEVAARVVATVRGDSADEILEHQ